LARSLTRAWGPQALAPHSERAHAGAYAYGVVGVLMLCSALSFMDRTLLSLMVDPIKRDFSLSET
jgi:hypothetical protein